MELMNLRALKKEIDNIDGQLLMIIWDDEVATEYMEAEKEKKNEDA